MPPGPWASTSNNLSCSIPNLRHIRTLPSSCYRRVCDSGSTARLPFSRNRKLQRHRLQLTPGHYTRGREALSPCSLPRIPGADGTSDTSRAHVPAGRATVLSKYDSTALTSPGGLPSPRPNEAFSRPSPRAGSRRWDVQDIFGTRCPPDACPPCMPTPKSQRSPRRARLRAPRQPCPRQSDLPTSRYQIWLPLMLLFWKPAPRNFQTARAYSVLQQPHPHAHIHMRAPSTMCRPRFWCPTCIAGEASNVTSRPWHPRQGCGESRPPSKQG